MNTSSSISFAQPARLDQAARCKATILALALASLPAISPADDSTWIGGASKDWNTVANWSDGVPNGRSAVITTTNPNICTITSTLSATPVDIRVGTGAGTTGRVDHIAGNAFTGNGNWL